MTTIVGAGAAGLSLGLMLDGPVVWTGPRKGADYNGLTVATLGILGPAPELTAVYLPEPWTPFHRLSFPSAFSPHNAPAGCYSIQGEISWSGSAPDINAVAHLEATAVRLGLLQGTVVMWHEQTVAHAYPVPVREPPEPERVIVHGRTGAHRYMNLDGVVAMSAERANHLSAAA